MTIVALVVAAASPASSLDRELERPLAAPQAAAFKRAEALYRQKDYAQAISEFDRVISLQPRFAVAITLRGYAHLELDHYDQALKDHDAVLLMAPESPNAWANSCWTRAVANRELERALKLCDQSARMAHSTMAFDSRAFVHFRMGDYAKAIEDYSASLKLQYSASSYYMRGVCRKLLGETEKGNTEIKYALKRHPGVDERYKKLGVALPAD
jgi:tetratricopeptide (TPR) repeat protein